MAKRPKARTSDRQAAEQVTVRRGRPAQVSARTSANDDRERSPLTESERGRWLRGIRFSGFSVLMMGVIVVGVIIVAPNLKAFVEQRQQIATLQNAIATDEAEIAALQAERERWNDSTYVMTQARDRLYYVNPGEISFIVINDLDPALLGDESEPVSDELESSTSSDWGRSLLASLLEAGLAETAPASAE